MTHRRAVAAVLLVALVSGGMALRPARAGPSVYTATLDQSPMGVAVDARTARAFVTTSDASGNGSVSVFDANSGALVRTVPLGPGLLPLSVCVDERAGRVFVLNQNSNTLSILDAGTGALLRTVAVGLSPALVLVDERAGRALVVNQASNTVTVLDARQGTVLRTVKVGEYPNAGAVDERSGRAFVGAFDGTIGVIDTRSGKLLRTTTVGGGVNGLAVDRRAGHVIVTSYKRANSLLSVLDATSGRLLHTAATSFYMDTLTVDERLGRAFVITLFNNSINVFDTRSGAFLRTVSLRHTPGSLAVDARTDRAFVISPVDDSVSVLDARSGVLRGTVTLDRHARGAAPWVSDAVAVDERAGQVFVAEDNGSTAHVSILDARGHAVLHAGPVGLFPMALAVDPRGGHVVVVGGPLPQQGSAFDTMTDGAADFLHTYLNGLLTWFSGHSASSDVAGTERGSVSVLDVPR